MSKIPFYRPYLNGREINVMQAALANGDLAGGGRLCREVGDMIARMINADKVLLTTSGTAALEMAVLLAGIGPGDEVIMPSFTFVSTANAVVLRGAKPVFADVNPWDLNMDINSLEEKITSTTRGIIPVHYAGLPCNLKRICSLAKCCQLTVIEDAAHAFLASFQGKPVGTWGDYGCFSFHATKNFTCGEGGALVINRPEMLHRAEIVWQKGTDREKFDRREVAFYTWQDVGSSYSPSGLLAAFLQAQLETSSYIQERRRYIWETYARELTPLADQELVQIQQLYEDAVSSYHLFYIVLPDKDKRKKVEAYLSERGIGTTFHYIPLHLSPMGKRLGYNCGDLPVTERMAESLLRLPLYPDLTDGEIDYTTEAVKAAIRSC